MSSTDFINKILEIWPEDVIISNALELSRPIKQTGSQSIYVSNASNNAIRFIELFKGVMNFDIRDTELVIEYRKSVMISEYISCKEFIFWFQTIFWDQIMTAPKRVADIIKPCNTRNTWLAPQRESNYKNQLLVEKLTGFIAMLFAEFNTVSGVSLLLDAIYIAKKCELTQIF